MVAHLQVWLQAYLRFLLPLIHVLHLLLTPCTLYLFCFCPLIYNNPSLLPLLVHLPPLFPSFSIIDSPSRASLKALSGSFGRPVSLTHVFSFIHESKNIYIFFKRLFPSLVIQYSSLRGFWSLFFSKPDSVKVIEVTDTWTLMSRNNGKCC